MRRRLQLLIALAFLSCVIKSNAQLRRGAYSLDLSGTWRFAMDVEDIGVSQKWFLKELKDEVVLPGSMASNGKGNDVTIHTPWTGQIVDSSWYQKPEYEPYRQPGHIKIPYWLQPVKYYKGAAWYQKTIHIPASWRGKELQLFIERSHWETTAWIDGKLIGMRNSLGTPHIFHLPALEPGTHQISVRVDNRVKDVNVGFNSHSITDHTQSNWNGMIGRLELMAKPRVFIEDVQIFPDLQQKRIKVSVKIVNTTGQPSRASLALSAKAPAAEQLPTLSEKVVLQSDTTEISIIYDMGKHPLLWDEFTPHLYQLKTTLHAAQATDLRQTSFGMREFVAKGTQFAVNGRTIFLRGTLECAIFPKTGFPPTDVDAWLRILKKIKSFGLNHVRFHSWTPPEAAFEAADQLGIYLQVECSSWANGDSRIGSGDPIDAWIYEESNRLVKAFGNHPSFCMMVYGNEPGGRNHTAYLKQFVAYWQQKDKRRMYTTGAGWPLVKESDYNNDPAPRIQGWGQGLKSIINSQPPRSDYDWSAILSKWNHPTVSHEIGQWCVYPDFKELSQYTGVLKAKNFEIFRDRLQQNGMLHLADSFLLASGKLQALCYKADIEAALRTKGFGGFQLLDLHDFPGQGTALVGVLNAFWQEKGYITAKEYSRFCNAVVPLARFPKMIYYNNETLKVPVEVAQFGPNDLLQAAPKWEIKTAEGQTAFKGSLNTIDIPTGALTEVGVIEQSLQAITEPTKLNVSITIGPFQNDWDIFVYPAALPEIAEDITVTQQLDEEALKTLQGGGKVLLTPKKGSIRDEAGGNIAVGFSSIFWNTAWTKGQAPHTLGILCDPKHPALRAFPTSYHSNWQWWDAMSHSNAIIVDSIAKGLAPIVRVIDDWFTARPLALAIECRVGKGKLLLTGIDLLTGNDKRPEAKQLLYSFATYMKTKDFNPATAVPVERLRSILR
ncbi:sugar-binding domain-containing protein [Niabella insulamsoli]|uniref:sugar-binding domain-containing protein n=1 Tax=Niabella insulamsoli TaxID=3144874 RepID=UPI0031FD8EA4